VQEEQDLEVGRGVVLVVGRPTSVQIAVLDHGCERIHGPLRALDAHHVRVPHEQDRALAPVPLQARDQVAAPCLEREDFGGNALAVEHGLDVIGGGGLVSAARIDPHELLQERQRLVAGLREIGQGGRRTRPLGAGPAGE
jgi:hypothetical protein